MAFIIAAAPIGAVYAAEGANSGTATSTPAGPAGDNQGPSKMSNPSTGGGAMKSGSGASGASMTTGRGDSAAGGGSRNGDHGN
jgi:hypothetical protein